MEYGNYTKYKIILLCFLFVFRCVRFVFEHFRNIWIVRKYFGVVGVFGATNCYFEYRVQILCVWLYTGTWFKTNVGHVLTCFQKMSQMCEQFSYELVVEMCWNLLVLNGPLTSLKHPFVNVLIINKTWLINN